MRAGQRDQRIIIESNAPTRNSVGDHTDVWTTYTRAWAKIVTGTGEEFIRAKEVNAELSHLIKTRFISGVTAGMRINHNGKFYNILAVFDPFKNKDALTLICNEQL